MDPGLRVSGPCLDDHPVAHDRQILRLVCLVAHAAGGQGIDLSGVGEEPVVTAGLEDDASRRKALAAVGLEGIGKRGRSAIVI